MQPTGTRHAEVNSCQQEAGILIGLIADKHIVEVSPVAELPGTVSQAYQGVDFILHCGDLGSTRQVLDALEAMAPVQALQVEHAPQEAEPRFVGTVHVVETERVRIGMAHRIDREEPTVSITRDEAPTCWFTMHFPQDMTAAETMTAKFGRIVDLVIFGGHARGIYRLL